MILDNGIELTVSNQLKLHTTWIRNKQIIYNKFSNKSDMKEYCILCKANNYIGNILGLLIVVYS